MDSVPGDLDLSQLAGKSGCLPQYLKNCAYDVHTRSWVPPHMIRHVPKTSQKALIKHKCFQVEQARSGASTCKRCGEKIAKLSLRIGYPAKDQRGEYGALVIWMHAACSRTCCDGLILETFQAGESSLKKKIIGYECLSEEEQTQLRESVLRAQDAVSMDAPPALAAPRQLSPHPAPPTLTVPLLPFQAEGLGWMLEREADQATRGGILADEMGMGKTLQTIALLLAGEASGPTLVVCPAAAMLQWRNEILRFTKENSLQVDLYYGFERKHLSFDCPGRQVVLTTYQTLESDYRREVNKYKVRCQWCERRFLPEKLKYHQKYFCGPDAQRTEKQLKTDLKSEAVKRMKIGGRETEIVLNPLTAIRGTSIAAARQRTKSKASKEDSEPQANDSYAKTQEPDVAAGPLLLPFPAAVLPAEARRVLTHHASFASTSSDIDIEMVSTTPPGRGKGRGRGKKRPSQQKACSQADPQGIADGSTPDTAAAKVPRRKWAQLTIGSSPSKNESLSADTATTPLSTATSFTAGKSTGWGTALRSKGSTKSISLDGVDSDSDLELVGEISHAAPAVKNEAMEKLASSAEDASLTNNGASHQESVEAAAAEEEEGGLPPRPDSEDECMSTTGGLDLSHSILFKTHWGRVVLDEAHRIKGRTNSTAQAAFALRAVRARWCLSGTPLQNRVGELYSLCRFVRFYPYAHYLCSKKGCKCASLHYRFSPMTSCCSKCGHTKMQHRSHFASTVSNPIKKFGFLGAGKMAMEKLRVEVLDRILLRRTKMERQADINLPSLQIKIRRDCLSAEEKDFYTSMYMQGRTKFDTYVDRGTLLHNYAHVFDLIMRLRQAVDHPYLIVHGSLKSEAGPMPTKSRGDADVCALCQDDICEIGARVRAQCGHSFHRDCVSEYLEQAPELPGGGIGCPTCFSPLTLSFEEEADGEGEGNEDAVAHPSAAPKPAKSIMQRIKSSEFKSSTKIEALLQEIEKMAAADSRSKALVFSQFVSFLELIEFRLKREGVTAAKLLGNMSIASRNNIIISFQTDPSLKVLLISLKAGGEGLNLQAADHIFLMDPWWNPASELQAIQRAHRIGQTRPVYATRFVATDTIEDKIIELQQKKQSVFDCTVGGSNTALQRLTADDIKFLFNQ